jgi:hypothetical protein
MKNPPVAHSIVQYDGNKCGICINVSRGINNTTKLDIKDEESANIGVLLEELIGRQIDDISSEQDSIVEEKLKSVLIHELRHIWQIVHSKSTLGPHSKIGQWWVRDADGAVDIMSEVDAFEIQRLFENANNISPAGATGMFLKINQNTRTEHVKLGSDRNTVENQIREKKASFLWKEYGYGNIKHASGRYKDKYIYRNGYSWEHPSSNANATLPPPSPVIESSPAENRE